MSGTAWAKPDRDADGEGCAQCAPVQPEARDRFRRASHAQRDRADDDAGPATIIAIGISPVADPVRPATPVTTARTAIAQNATAVTSRRGAGRAPGIAGIHRRAAQSETAAAIAVAAYAGQVEKAKPAGTLGSALGIRTTMSVRSAGAAADPAP